MNETLTKAHISTFLPTELWNAIFHHVKRKDLTKLARVSRLFQEEAEHVLYYHINLRDATGARLASWCMSVICERRRASRVHTLLLSRCLEPPRDYLEHSSTEIQQLIAQAFRAVVNLKELYDFGKIGSVPIVGPSTFDGCTFRLTGLSGSFAGLTAGEMSQFLSTQPDISYWFPGSDFIRLISVIPPNTLPSIRELVLEYPKKLPLFYDRPIQKLWLTFYYIPPTQYNQLAAPSLRPFEETLRVLVYKVYCLLAGQITIDVIRSLTDEAPNIEFLGFHFLSGSKYTVSTDEQKDIVEAISGFKRLHSLYLNIRMAALHDPNPNPPDPSNPLEHDPIWTPDSPAQSRKVASMFMESCPSLQRISFPFKERKVGGRSDLCYLCYGRPRDGGPGGKAEAWLEGFNIINWAWWVRSVKLRIG